MVPGRLPFHTAARLALVAMLALALLPAASRALAYARGDAGWSAICTAQGLRWAPAKLADDGHTVVGHGQFEACALCVLGLGAAPLPSRDASTPAAASEATARLAQWASAARQQLAWAGARARAPPASPLS